MVLLIGIHILAVVAWVGGAVLLTFIVEPNLATLPPQDAGRVGQGIGKSFAILGWTSAAVITVTGLLRAYLTGYLGIDTMLNTSYGTLLLLKVLLFAAVLVITVMIGVAARELEKPSSQEAAMAAQKRISILSKTNIALGAVIIFMAVGLRHGGF